MSANDEATQIITEIKTFLKRFIRHSAYRLNTPNGFVHEPICVLLFTELIRPTDNWFDTDDVSFEREFFVRKIAAFLSIVCFQQFQHSKAIVCLNDLNDESINKNVVGLCIDS